MPPSPSPRPRPRSVGALAALIAIAAVVALRAFDPAPVRVMRFTTFDFYQRQYLRPLAAGSPVALVTLDEASAEGPDPWRPSRLAALIEALAAAGVRAVALTAPVAERGDGLPRLARAMATVPTVLAEGAGGAPAARWRTAPGGTAIPGRLWVADDPVANPPAIEAVAAGIGHAFVAAPEDHAARRIPAFLRIGDALRPALALALLGAAERAEGYRFETSLGALAAVRIGGLRVPTDARGGIWPRYAPPGSIPALPAASVLGGTAPEARLAGRVVLIGTAGVARATPVGAMPALEIHALLVDRLMRGGILTRPPWAGMAETTAVGLMGLVALALLVMGRGGWALAGIGVLALAPAVLATAAFAAYGLLIDAILATVAVLVVLFVVLEVRAVHRLAGAKKAPRGRCRRRGGVSG